MEFEEFLGVNPWTALFTLANTVTLFLVLKKFLFKPVMKMITDRQNEIDDMYHNADDFQREASKMREAYERKFAAASEEADRLLKEAVVRGQKREEEIVREANREAEAIRTKATVDTVQEKRKAITEAKNEIADMAMEIAAKVIGKNLNTADQAALIDQFIEEMGKQL